MNRLCSYGVAATFSVHVLGTHDRGVDADLPSRYSCLLHKQKL